MGFKVWGSGFGGCVCCQGLVVDNVEFRVWGLGARWIGPASKAKQG